MIPRAIACALCLTITRSALAQTIPGTEWDTVTQSDRRWDHDELRRIGKFVDSLGSGAVVIVHEGRIVASWGNAKRKLPMTSVRKSLLHALVGRAVDRGQIRLESTLAELRIDDDPPLTDRERTARVGDLLASRSGIYHEAAYEPAGMRSRRPARGSAAPGERWFYNNWDFNTLGAIYEQRTSASIFRAFAEEIARPLGMQDYRAEDGQYVREPASRFPAYGFRLTARDLARFGLLYLRRGRWGDNAIVPAPWIDSAVQPISNADEDGAYGRLWWVARDGQLVPGVSLGTGTFAARGNGPHYLVIIPDRQLVMVHLADTETPSPERWVERQDVGRVFARVLGAMR
jgi:CubicO group peptidase (beta-lactamase class C family)